MRAIIQRVTEASVVVEGEMVGQIGKGLLVFLGIGHDDDEKDLDYMVDKITGLRIFEDSDDKMNLSLMDIQGEILIVSQFTLYGDVRKGKRPSFTLSAGPEKGLDYYNRFIGKIREKNIKYGTGEFGADMKVSLLNDGPVTIMLDSEKNF